MSRNFHKKSWFHQIFIEDSSTFLLYAHRNRTIGLCALLLSFSLTIYVFLIIDNRYNLMMCSELLCTIISTWLFYSFIYIFVCNTTTRIIIEIMAIWEKQIIIGYTSHNICFCCIVLVEFFQIYGEEHHYFVSI